MGVQPIQIFRRSNGAGTTRAASKSPPASACGRAISTKASVDKPTLVSGLGGSVGDTQGERKRVAKSQTMSPLCGGLWSEAISFWVPPKAASVAMIVSRNLMSFGGKGPFRCLRNRCTCERNWSTGWRTQLTGVMWLERSASSAVRRAFPSCSVDIHQVFAGQDQKLGATLPGSFASPVPYNLRFSDDAV